MKRAIDTAREWRTRYEAGLPLALAAGALDACFAFFVLVIQSFLATAVHANTSRPAYAIALYGATRVLFQAPGGLLARRVGAKRLYPAGMLVGALSLGGLALASGTATVYLLVLLYGLATAVAWPAIYLRAGDLSDDRRGQLFGLVTLCAMGGTAAGLGAGVLLADRVSARVLMASGGIVLAIAALAAVYLIQRIGAKAPPIRQSQRSGPVIRLRSVATGRLFVTLALQGLGLAMLLPLIRQYVHQQLGLQMQDLIVLVLPAAIVAGLAILPAGHLTDRFGRGPITAIGAVGVATGVGLMAITKQQLAFALAIIPLATGYAVTAPALSAWITDLTDDVGGAVGLALTVQGVATAIGPALTGVLLSVAGLRSPLLVASGVWLASAICIVVPLTSQTRLRAPRPVHGKLLLTGGAGFIGHYVSREAIQRGWDVTILDNFSTGVRDRIPAAAHLIEADLTDPSLEQRLAGHTFDAVIHLAAQTSVPRSMAEPDFDRAVNLEGTARLLGIIRAANPACRFVFTSSAAIYGDAGTPLVGEQTPARPISFYGVHKYHAEQRILASDLPYAILRPANVYGPGQRADADGGVIATFLKNVYEDRPLEITGDGEQTRDFVYVHDVARALVDAASWQASGIWNVSTKTETSLNALVGQIAQLSGRRPQIRYIPERNGDIHHSCLDNRQIRNMTDWRPRTKLGDGLAATFLAQGGTMPRSIAVVPAYNEEPTVAAVLDRLYPAVDELLVVDDGSTDRTRAAIEAWLPGHDRARLLCFDQNQGLSAAYHLAFSHLRDEMAAGEISPDDYIMTIDADGQHELSALEDLKRIATIQQLDALLVRRDLITYPIDKRLGNWLMSAWATIWAGRRLYDVESGYRIFRMGALAEALDYYKGYKYSETVEVAVILCRLGYKVRNDVLVPVPIFRSRTRMKDALIDLAVMPAAAWRVGWNRGRVPAPAPATVLYRPGRPGPAVRFFSTARRLVDSIADQFQA